MAENPVVWFEIYVQNMLRAQKFYEGVLQLKLKSMDAPMPDLEMLQFEGSSEKYGVPGALVKMEGCPSGGMGTLVYFGCQDCTVEAARVEQFGGSIVRPLTSLGEFGRMVLARDTEGNMFGLHSM